MMKHMILQLHITGSCNLRCRHCYIDEHAGQLSLGQIKAVLDQFSQLLDAIARDAKEPVQGHVHITGGEPFLHPQIRRVLLLLLRYRRKFRYAIMSNGTALKHLTLLKWLKLKSLQVSIDGDRQTHDAIRGGGNLQRVCRGLELLHSRGIRTRVSFTANLENYRQFPQVAQLCREHHVGSLWSDRYVPVPGGTLRPMDAAHMAEYVRLLRLEAENPQNKQARLIVQNHRALQFQEGKEQPYRCMAGEGLIVVDEHGNILPCRRMPIVCGNIQKTDLRTVYYESPEFLQLRSHCVSGKCASCPHGKTCAGGLRCMTWAVHGSYDRPDPCCYV